MQFSSITVNLFELEVRALVASVLWGITWGEGRRESGGERGRCSPFTRGGEMVTLLCHMEKSKSVLSLAFFVCFQGELTDGQVKTILEHFCGGK